MTRKKLLATREHGKELFGAGQYAEAFAVYERGMLITSTSAARWTRRGRVNAM
jgi:hypothetical protein